MQIQLGVAGGWTRIGPDGGTIVSVLAGPLDSSRLYASTWRGDVYRSLDGAATWQPAGSALGTSYVHRLICGPPDCRRIYAGTSGGLYFSDDGADSWQRLPNLGAVGVNQLAFHPSAPAEIYAATGGGVYRSRDGGSHWERANSGLRTTNSASVWTIAASSFNGLTLFAGNDAGLFTSSDQAEHWRFVGLGVPASGVSMVEVDPHDPTRLFVSMAGLLLRSIDGGLDWEATLGIARSSTVRQLAFDPNDSNRIFAASDNGVYLSVDGGAGWRNFSAGLRPSASDGAFPTVYSIAREAGSAARIFAGTGFGLFVSSDALDLWRPAGQGLTAWPAYHLAIDSRAPGALYVATGGGIFDSLDGGASWRARLVGPFDFLAVDSSDPRRLYAGGDGLARSLDRGESWREINKGLVAGLFGRRLIVGDLVIDRETPNRLLVGGDYGIFASRDFGESWRRLNFPAFQVAALAVDRENPSTYYAGTSLGVFRSLDGGEKWSPVNQGLGPIDETGLTDVSVLSLAGDPVRTSTLFAGTREHGGFRSLDGGETWTAVNEGLPDLRATRILIDPNLATTLYAATQGGVFRSVDGGERWYGLGLGLRDPDTRSLAVDPFDPLRIYAGSSGAGVSRLEFLDALHFAQFGDGASGGLGISSQLVLLQPEGGGPVGVVALLRDDDGSASNLEWSGRQVRGRLDLVVPASGLALASSGGQGPLQSGSLEVRSDQPLEGMLIFDSVAGAAGVEASVPLTEFEAPAQVRLALGVNTGMALANLESVANPVDLRVYDPDRRLLASGRITLPPEGHRAVLIPDLVWQEAAGARLDFNDFLGIVAGRAAGRIAVTMIQTRPGEFVSFPVSTPAPSGQSGSTAPSEASWVLEFPQFGDGAAGGRSFSSQLLLLNRSLEAPAEVRVEFRDDQGNSLNRRLFSSAGDGPTTLAIPPGGLRVLETGGTGDLISGSVSVRSDQPLTGRVVFSGTEGAAGVADSQPSSGWLAAVESDVSRGLRTGLAVVNLDDVGQSIELRLFERDGAEVATAELDLAPRGHRALHLDELDWRAEDRPFQVSRFAGVVRAAGPGNSAATVIRVLPGQLATLPVAVPRTDRGLGRAVAARRSRVDQGP